MTETRKVTKEDGFKKKYLQNKRVKLMPIIDRGMTLTTVNKKNDLHSFAYDGAVRSYQCAMNERMQLRDPFESDEERFWFESYFNRDLGTTSNSWFMKDEATVKITLDQAFKQGGHMLDMSNPEDVLAVKILGTQDEICKNPAFLKDPSKNRPHWKFMLVDEEYEETSASRKKKAEAEAWIEYGRIIDSKKKMSDFLEVYYANNRKPFSVPDDPTEDYLLNEVSKILDDDKKGFIEASKDEDAELKLLITKGIRVGAIEKHGINQYSIPGEAKYTFKEFVDYMKLAKEQKEEDIHDVYQKLLARIDITNNIKNKGKGKKSE